jgi:hypothetical protein
MIFILILWGLRSIQTGIFNVHQIISIRAKRMGNFNGFEFSPEISILQLDTEITIAPESETTVRNMQETECSPEQVCRPLK